MNIKKSIFILTLILINNNMSFASESSSLFRTKSYRNLTSIKTEQEYFPHCSKPDKESTSHSEYDDDLGVIHNNEIIEGKNVTSCHNCNLIEHIGNLLDNFYGPSYDQYGYEIVEEIEKIIECSNKDIRNDVYTCIKQEIFSRFINNGIYLESESLLNLLPSEEKKSLAINILEYFDHKILDERSLMSVNELLRVIKKGNLNKNIFVYFFETLKYIEKNILRKCQ